MFHFSRNSIDVFGLSIHYYGILIALGVLLGVLLAARRQKRLNLPPETGLDLALICLPVAVVCARAYYVIFEWSAYKDDLLSIFNLRRGGLAIYGGVLGGALAVFVYSRIKKRSFLSLADLAAPSLALGQAVGRWGNFFNQEAYGAAVTQPSRMHFPLAVFIDADQTWHYATFFYESAWCFLIVALLLLFERRRFFRKRGDVFFWYLILYGLERAAVEGRGNDGDGGVLSAAHGHRALQPGSAVNSKHLCHGFSDGSRRSWRNCRRSRPCRRRWHRNCTCRYRHGIPFRRSFCKLRRLVYRWW